MAITPDSECELIVFGRYPAPGKTKTRLIPQLGPLGAAAVHRRLSENTLATISRIKRPAAVTFAYCGASDVQMRRWVGRYPIDFRLQHGRHLGRRMQHAIDAAFAAGRRRVVLVGTDVPDLTAADLQNAFAALETHEVVIGPSQDGGYWLIGAQQPIRVFDAIDWGTDRVLGQTLSAIAQCGRSCALLREQNDIDTPADLDRWQPQQGRRRPYLSVIIPTLNEAASIEETVNSARSADGEILVADGGSTDDTAARARGAGARVILASGGRAHQQNSAAGAARGRVLIFLHADTRLPKGFEGNVFDAFLDPMVVAGAFRFETDYPHPGMRLIETAVNLRSTYLKMPYGDQALFVPKPRFDQVGGFPNIAIAEDLALVRSLGKLGKIHIAPRSAVTSGRRWRAMGLWKTTLINGIIALGCLAGVDPRRLAPWYWKNLKRPDG